MDKNLYKTLVEEERNIVWKLYIDLNQIMRRIALQITGNEADAEDAVANTFLKVMKYLHKIIPLSSDGRKAYCISIAKNEAINILHNKKQEKLSNEVEKLIDQSQCSVEENYFTALEQSKLQSNIQKLLKEERQLLYMRINQNLTFRDIGNLLCISEENAKKRYQRILKKLRQQYKKHDFNMEY